jgi:alpha-tubulin suppressor-like RCC1 family protein
MTRFLKSTGKILMALLICLTLLISINNTTYGYKDETWIRPETISSGLAHACGIRGDGTLVCWGKNDYGQSSPPSGTFRQVGAGFTHSCGLHSDGTIVCWGNNNLGQLNHPTGTFTQISVGGHHACGVRNNGDLFCWGRNNVGQTTSPTGTFKQVSAGSNHSCALDDEGSVLCWGLNSYLQAPEFPLTGPFIQVSAGDRHTCALEADGTKPFAGVTIPINNRNPLTPLILNKSVQVTITPVQFRPMVNRYVGD